MKTILVAILMLFGANQTFAQDQVEPQPQPDPQPVVLTQTYKITIDNNWNRRDHLSVPGNAHFSPFVAVSHNSDYDLVTMGGLTSAELEPVAELGQTQLIEPHISDAQQAGSVLDQTVTQNQFILQEATQTFEVTVSEDHPFLSLVSMIAPSPDWVVAVSNLKLYNKEQGFFTGVTRQPLYALDAGTEGGDVAGNFSINNNPTTPAQPVNRLTGRGFNAPFAFMTIEKVSEQ